MNDSSSSANYDMIARPFVLLYSMLLLATFLVYFLGTALAC